MVRKAVILAAGLSTRTYPLTLGKPKPLLKIADRPNLAHLLQGLKEGGIREVILVVGFGRDQIEGRFGRCFEGMSLTYVIQEKALGTGHALLQATPFLGDEPFLVLNGDDCLLPDALSPIARFVPSLLVAPHPQPFRFGVVTVKEGWVIAIREKPKDAPPGSLVSTGVWSFPPEALEWLQKILPAEDGEIRLPDIVPWLMERGIKAVITKEGWVPITYPWDVLSANWHLFKVWKEGRAPSLLPSPSVQGEVHPTAELRGDIWVKEGAKIRRGAKVLGPTIIGSGSIVGEFTEVIGSVIGENCAIGPGSRLENCVLFDGVHIGREAVIEWSVVGDGVVIDDRVHTFSKVPSGITVRSVVKGQLVDTGLERLGSIIGDGARIGKGAILYPGVKVWGEKTVPSSTEVLEDVR